MPCGTQMVWSWNASNLHTSRRLFHSCSARFFVVPCFMDTEMKKIILGLISSGPWFKTQINLLIFESLVKSSLRQNLNVLSKLLVSCGMRNISVF